MPVQSGTLTNLWPLWLFLARPMLLPPIHTQIDSTAITQWGVNQDQLNANRQYKSTGRVNGYKRHFFLCFYKIWQYNKCGRSRAIVRVICSVIFCLVISEYYSTIVDVTGQVWLMFVFFTLLFLIIYSRVFFLNAQNWALPLVSSEKKQRKCEFH